MSSLRSSNSSAAIAVPRRLHVEREQAGERLDKWLSAQSGIHSREMARRLILEGAVRLNTAPAEPSSRVRPDDLVEYSVPPPRPLDLVPEAKPLDVLYEDDALLVLNKPPGVAMHPSPGHGSGTLVHFLLAHCRNLSGIGGAQRPGIVHRLDKDTSGVLVVAKTDRAHQGLAAQFKAHSIERSYMALVVGAPERNRGTVDLPLGRDPRHRLKQMVRPDGKRAVTHWRVERRLAPFALMRMELETGRTHQIRVHLAHIGLPVLGDPLYGRGRHRGLELPDQLMENLNTFRRQALHAGALGFEHPESGVWLRFRSPLPEDFRRLTGWISGRTAEIP
ncbi:MAG: RluA family pseudouridine synthase [bacterium]